MAKPHSIDLAAIYENDSLMLGTYTENAHRNAQAALRRRGFRLSICKEAYYHPDHWDTSVMSFSDDPMKPDVGDTWIFNDCFKAKTDAARAWLKKDEDEDRCEGWRPDTVSLCAATLVQPCQAQRA